MTSPEPPAHRPLPVLRLVTIGVVMTLAVALIWSVIRPFDNTNVPEDDPTPPVTIEPSSTAPASTATPPRDSTPNPPEAPEWPVGSLPALLAYAPDRLADGSLPLNDVARYADLAGWMAANGIAPPRALDDPALPAWEGALDPLALPASLRERGLDPIWRQTYGFDLTQVSQILVVGQAPDYVMVIRGTYDPAAMQAAWVSSGYQPVEVEGQTIWSLFPGDQIDLSAPASRPALGTLNNVILLEDGTLIAASKMSRLGSALRVVNGDAASLAANEDVAALLARGSGVERLASAVIARGTLLQGTAATMPLAAATPADGTPGANAIATPTTGAGMPEVRLALIGIPLPPALATATPVAPSPSPPGMWLMLVVDDLDDARSAVLEIRPRIEDERSPVTGEPYTDRLSSPELHLVNGGDHPLVIVEGMLADGAADWLAIVSDRDLGYAFWLPEP